MTRTVKDSVNSLQSPALIPSRVGDSPGNSPGAGAKVGQGYGTVAARDLTYTEITKETKEVRIYDVTGNFFIDHQVMTSWTGISPDGRTLTLKFSG